MAGLLLYKIRYIYNFLWKSYMHLVGLEPSTSLDLALTTTRGGGAIEARAHWTLGIFIIAKD